MPVAAAVERFLPPRSLSEGDFVSPAARSTTEAPSRLRAHGIGDREQPA